MTNAGEGQAISEWTLKIAILLGVVTALIVLPASALLWMISVPGRSYAGPLPPLTSEQAQMASRLQGTVRAVASVPHNTAHPDSLERAAVHIEGTLQALGYQIHRQPFQADGQQVRNIEVVIEPATAGAATLVVGAHYDSCCDAPGANDNGTGTAAVLELARLLADLRGRAAIRIRLVLFVNEEPPIFQTDLMGSLVYANRLQRSGENVLGMLSLETLGFYSEAEGSQHYPPPLGMLYPGKGNVVAFVGSTSSRRFVRRTIKSFRALTPFPSEGGTAPGFIQGIDWSDHWSFERVGIPALMVTDTGPFRYPHYHSPADTADAIDYDRLARIVWGLSQVIRSWALAEPTGPAPRANEPGNDPVSLRAAPLYSRRKQGGFG
ncbi:MAG TPA: M28 family peptidase [Allosphingosinicella sp.]|nr:M28 family peptidase [Allosphingosinicella sp.]